MSTLYEYYITGDDTFMPIRGTTWRAQTFTPSTAHKITSVKLKLYRIGSPGTLTVSIRATDGSGHPTGEDLCSGTIDGNSLTTDTAGVWYEITLGAGYDLQASTKYVIVCRAPSGDSSNSVPWRRDVTSATYAGGCYEYSDNSGSSWTSYPDYDGMFEEWGEVEVTAKTSSDTGSGADAIATGNPLATLTGAETGSGLDIFTSLLGALSASEVGSGVEGISMPSAILAGSETGSSIEAIIARLLAAFDTGYGIEAGSVGGDGLLKNLFATELGQGRDALVVKRWVFAGGEGTKFFGGGDKPPHRAS